MESMEKWNNYFPRIILVCALSSQVSEASLRDFVKYCFQSRKPPIAHLIKEQKPIIVESPVSDLARELFEKFPDSKAIDRAIKEERREMIRAFEATEESRGWIRKRAEARWNAGGLDALFREPGYHDWWNRERNVEKELTPTSLKIREAVRELLQCNPCDDIEKIAEKGYVEKDQIWWHYFESLNQMRKTGLLAELNGSRIFTGTTSATLLTFTEFGEKGGRLLATGSLVANGTPPFGGSLDSPAFNDTELSAVPLNHLSGARLYTGVDYWYSSQGKRLLGPAWSPEKARAQIEANEHRLKDGIGGILEGRNREQIAIERSRLSAWTHLTDAEKKLVEEGFPVLFGFVSPRYKVNPRQYASSTYGVGDPAELKILGSVEPKEIRAIFVPRDKIPLVTKLVEGRNIHVAPIEIAFPPR